MTHLWVIDNNCVKYFQIQFSSEDLWSGHRFSVYVHCDLDLGDMTVGQGHDTPLVMDNNCVKCYPDPTWQWGVMARTRILGMWALWSWPRKYDLGSRSWLTLGSWTTTVWNIIQIQLGSEELWPGHGFWACVHCKLDLRDMTLGQDHDTSLVMDNNCVKYYQDPTWQCGDMAQTRI